MVEGLTKDHAYITHGHGQQYGDWLREGLEWDWQEVGKERKSEGNHNSIKNKNKIKNKDKNKNKNK